jgi:N-acetylmuramoyl-L-alanine amidase
MDHDGLPTEWDTMNRIDPDADDFTNLAEYIGGTNPRIYNDSDRDLAQIVIVSGNAQSALPWQLLPDPLVIKTSKIQGYNTDGTSIDVPLSRQSVTFSTDEDMTLGYGDLQRFKTISTLTDTDGTASVTVYLSGRPGQHPIRAKLSNGREVTFNVTIQQENPLLKFQNDTVLPWGVIGLPYPKLGSFIQLALEPAAVAGGAIFTLSSGSKLPRGLTLYSSGIISGIPSGLPPGRFNFTVQATRGDRRVVKTFQIRLKAAVSGGWPPGEDPDPEEPNPPFKLKLITKPNGTSGIVHAVSAHWRESYNYNDGGKKRTENHFATFSHYLNGYERVTPDPDTTDKKPSMDEMMGMIAMPNLDEWNYKSDLAQSIFGFGSMHNSKRYSNHDESLLVHKSKSWNFWPVRLVAVDAETENSYVELPLGTEVTFILKKSVVTAAGAEPIVTYEPMTMKIPKGESFADLSQELIEKLKFKDSDDDYLDMSYDLLSIEVVEVSPKTKDEDGNEIAGSEKPNSGKPLTPFVEVDPNANKIAHRELKVLIGSDLKDKKVTWTLEALPGATPATIRGDWDKSPTHKDRFEASTAYGANSFRKVSQSSGETTVGAGGHTAIRVNVPPIGFNQVRIRIQIEGMSTPIDLIDMEVPGVVVIDPGHGGLVNIGASSANNATAHPSGIQEKAMALDCGILLRDSLRSLRNQQKRNLKVFMTRSTNINLSLQARANKARDNGADIMFSIHFNGNTAPAQVRGTETHIDSTGNFNASQHTALARRANDAAFGVLSGYDSGARDRGPKAERGLDALSDPDLGNSSSYYPCRGALLELDFIDVPAVDQLLNTNANHQQVRQEAMEAVANSLIEDLTQQPAQ